MIPLVAACALLLLIALGVHISVALGVVAVVLIALDPAIPLVLVAQAAWDSLDKYALVAIPFFIFAGNLMSRGDLALIVMELVGTLVRGMRGGMALATAVAAVFFAAVNGSSVACAVALGPAATRLLPKEGYPPRFAASVVAVCGTLGLMIPPSLTFILIGSIVGLPITDLFIAGLLPGLMEAALLGITTVILSRRHGYGTVVPGVDVRGFARLLPRSLGAVGMPFLIIGTIYAGWFTPTEVSALAAVYAVVLVTLVYRTAGLGTVWDTGRESVMQTVMIFGILLGSGLLTVVMTRLGLAEQMTELVRAGNVGPFEFLLLVNLLLIVIGMFLDGVSMIVLLSPILFPMAQASGVDPIHFAVIMTALVEVATLTPPVGLNLFVMSRITGLPLHAMAAGVAPFYIVRVLALVIINSVPLLSLALVR